MYDRIPIRTRIQHIRVAQQYSTPGDADTVFDIVVKSIPTNILKANRQVHDEALSILEKKILGQPIRIMSCNLPHAWNNLGANPLFALSEYISEVMRFQNSQIALQHVHPSMHLLRRRDVRHVKKIYQRAIRFYLSTNGNKNTVANAAFPIIVEILFDDTDSRADPQMLKIFAGFFEFRHTCLLQIPPHRVSGSILVSHRASLFASSEAIELMDGTNPRWSWSKNEVAQRGNIKLIRGKDLTEKEWEDNWRREYTISL